MHLNCILVTNLLLDRMANVVDIAESPVHDGGYGAKLEVYMVQCINDC